MLKMKIKLQALFFSFHEKETTWEKNQRGSIAIKPQPTT